ncbi:Solute carrier family 25 member 44 [Linum grandiflorum]
MAKSTDVRQPSFGHTEINWDKLDKTKLYVVGAGIFTGITVALYPISVIKTRLQVATKDTGERNAFSVIRGLVKTDGIRGLYRGFGTVITGAVPARIIFLTALETTKVASFKMVESLKLSEASEAAVANGIAGMTASLCSQGVFVPIDVVMGHESKSSARQVVRNLVNDSGWLGLYKGLGPRFLSSSLWGTSMILAYEYMKRLCAKDD